MWICKVHANRNIRPQTLQQYGSSSEWQRIWEFKLLLYANDRSHTKQVSGRSPECVRICSFRPREYIYFFWQTLHWCGLSPVCILIWSFSKNDSAKDLLHVGHEYGFSPECFRLWAVRRCRRENERWHTSQLKGRLPVWQLMCTFTSCKTGYCLPHTLHTYCCVPASKWMIPFQKDVGTTMSLHVELMLSGMARSFVWVCICTVRLVTSVNRFLQTSQA